MNFLSLSLAFWLSAAAGVATNAELRCPAGDALFVFVHVRTVLVWFCRHPVVSTEKKNVFKQGLIHLGVLRQAHAVAH